MHNNDEYIGLIEKYIDGNLDQADQADFNRLLNESPAFQQMLGEAQATIASLRKDFDSNLKSTLHTMYDETVQAENTKRQRTLYYWAAAAMMIVTAGISWHYLANQANGNEQLFQAYYQVYPMKPHTRGVDNANDATHYYQEGQYADALPLLLDDLAQNPGDDVNLIYAGNSYLSLGKYEDAITMFEKGARSNDNIVRQTSRWYLALSFLAASDEKKSIALLEDVVQRNELYAAKASTLLEKLRSAK